MYKSIITATKVSDSPCWKMVWTDALTEVSAAVANPVSVDGTKATTN